MARYRWLVAVVVGAFFGALPSVAGAQVLGSVSPPSNASPHACVAGNILAQIASDPGLPYSAPADGWITQWQTDTTGDHAGDSITLVALRPTGTPNDFTIVALDPETLPSMLPAGNVVTFTPANPIAVDAGDTFGLVGPASSVCFYSDGAIPAGGEVGEFGDPSPTPGQTISSPTLAASMRVALDLAAMFVPTSEDAGVTTTAGPGNATAGYPAVLSSTVTNAGLGSLPITFSDHVPPGLRIDSAVAGSGTCTIALQTVTCTLDLSRGASAPVQIVVTPSANGSYQNDVTVAPPPDVPDFNSANDGATSVLLVLPQAPAPPPHCVVPRLRWIQAWFAERVLGLLGCQVGMVTHVHSRTVPKGRVIGTAPGAGTYPVLRVVSVRVSSGPRKRKPHGRHGTLVRRVGRG